MKRFLFFTILLMATACCFAQQASVVSKIDSVTILVGEQAHLTVDVTAKPGARVIFPQFKRSQNIVPGVEVLKVSEADSSKIDGMVRVRKVFTLTSFNEHLYAIPGIKVKVDGETYYGNQLALKVIVCDVDTLHPEKFFPPKDVQDNPFLWEEWYGVFVVSIIVMLLSGCFLYLILRLKQNKPIITHVRIVKRIPAHQKALDEIKRLKNEHFDTVDEQKQYYTQLTDTLRKYIRERFGFNAMEMTSSEILQHLHEVGDDKMMAELRELFLTADLVKFAKYSSLLNEKDMNLVNAMNFIDLTKREDSPTKEIVVPKLSDSDMKIRKNRITIKSLLWAIAIFMVLLISYVVFQLYQLLG